MELGVGIVVVSVIAGVVCNSTGLTLVAVVLPSVDTDESLNHVNPIPAVTISIKGIHHHPMRRDGLPAGIA